MKRVLLFSFVIALSNIAYSQTVKNGKFCSDDQDLCINATLRVDDGKGLVSLSGRVSKTTRPGFLRITLHGYAERKIYKAYVMGRLKGKYSEVIDFKNAASHNSDTHWKVVRFEYLLVE